MKCTRCGRALKQVHTLNGQPFGPVCILKMGGTITVKYAGGRPTRRHTETVALPSNQLTFAIDNGDEDVDDVTSPL